MHQYKLQYNLIQFLEVPEALLDQLQELAAVEAHLLFHLLLQEVAAEEPVMVPE
jgi:hypothetical protein